VPIWQFFTPIKFCPPLTEFGLKEQDFPAVVAKSQKSSSMKGNPVTLTDDELMEILKKANK